MSFASLPVLTNYMLAVARTSHSTVIIPHLDVLKNI
jgi:hypothetical protein